MKYVSERYIKEAVDVNTVLTGAMAVGSLGGLALGATQLLMPAISKAINNTRYDISGCNKLQDPNDRDNCDIKALSKGISKLRNLYSVAAQKKNQAMMVKLTNEIKKQEAKMQEITEKLAFRKQNAGVV